MRIASEANGGNTGKGDGCCGDVPQMEPPDCDPKRLIAPYTRVQKALGLR